MQEISKYICYGKKLEYVASHCAPPVGFNSQGRRCQGCQVLKVIKEAQARLGIDAEAFDNIRKFLAGEVAKDESE